MGRSIIRALSGNKEEIITMMQFSARTIRLFIGLFLYAVGIVMTINANLGLSPWDVFHQGLSQKFGITMGQASIAVGGVVVALNWLLGERIGWSTIGNMVFIGLFIDVLMINQLIPAYDSFVPGLVLMLLGLLVIGLATYFYLGVGRGSGPRDGLMVVLTKKTGKSVRLVRNSIELVALLLGYLMGGHVGIGTVVMALTTGYFVQFVFKIFNFQVDKVEHRFIDEDLRYLRRLFRKDGLLEAGTSKAEE